MDILAKEIESVRRSSDDIAAITRSLAHLFLMRTVVVLCLTCAGVACLYFGMNMLNGSLAAGNQAALIEIAGALKITAGGFGAVVMTASLVPFYFAYLSRPTIQLTPTRQDAYSVSVGGHGARPSLIKRLLAALTGTGRDANHVDGSGVAAPTGTGGSFLGEAVAANKPAAKSMSIDVAQPAAAARTLTGALTGGHAQPI